MLLSDLMGEIHTTATHVHVQLQSVRRDRKKTETVAAVLQSEQRAPGPNGCGEGIPSKTKVGRALLARQYCTGPCVRSIYSAYKEYCSIWHLSLTLY